MNDSVYLNDIEILNSIDGNSIYNLDNKLIQIYDNAKGCYYFNRKIIKSDFFIKKGFRSLVMLADSSPRRVSRGHYKRDIVILDTDLQTAKEIILNDIDYGLITYTQNELIVGGKEILLAYNYQNRLLWQYSVLNNYYLLGVFEDDLLVVLNDSNILRTDIQTGELKEQFKMILFFNTENEIIAQYDFIQFQEDRLIYYRFGQYAEYDLKLNKITYEFDIKKVLEKEKLQDNVHSYIKEGDLLYFYVSGFGSFSLPSIVVLDIRTKEIVWKHILDNPDVFYKDFQKSEMALYLLDSGNTLHIFEKE